jgi:hypothetical protein
MKERPLFIRILRGTARVICWTLIVLLSLILLLTVFSAAFVQTLWHLATGWFVFLRNTLPQVQVNGSMLAGGLLALALAAVALHRFLVGWDQRTGGSKNWRWRHTLALLALLAPLFMASMATAGIAHQLGWMKSGPPLTQMGFASDFDHLHRLRQLHMTLNWWLEEHENHYPEDLAELLAWDGVGQMQGHFFFDRFPKENPEPWFYGAAGQEKPLPTDLPVVATPRPDARGRRAFMTSDNQQHHVPEAEFQRRLERLRTYRAEQHQPSAP